MSQVRDKLQHLQEKLINLSSRLEDLSDQNPLARIKRRFLNGTVLPLGVKAYHKGTAQGNIQMDFKSGPEYQILIDDLLEQKPSKLEYRLTNVDLKIKKEVLYGIIYRENGIVTVQKIILEYDNQVKNYRVEIPIELNYKGRILVMITFTPRDYSINPVQLEPIYSDLSRAGEACRY